MNKRAEGVDISKYQSSYDPLVAPQDFLIAKATEGPSYSDPKFKTYAGLDNRPDIFGAYHYFRSGYSWEAQAENYLKTIEGRGVIFHSLDFEKINNKPSMRFQQDGYQWMRLVERETEEVVGLYTSPSVHQEYLTQYGAKWMRHFPLWIAQYPFRKWDDRLLNVPTSDAWHPSLPAGVDEWAFWQYSDKANGKAHGVKSGGIDKNVFNGTILELR